MKHAASLLILPFLLVSLAHAAAPKKASVTVTPITEEELRELSAANGALLGSTTATCQSGNAGYAYAVPDLLYGIEHWSVFVDPQNCYAVEPGIVRPVSISVAFYATATINTCGAFQMQAHIEAAEWDGDCPSPGYDALCVSELQTITIPQPGLWLLKFDLNSECLMYGPFFASITLFNDGGCLPGPLSIVIDQAPLYCNTYNNYDGAWYDVVATYGIPGKMTMFATVESVDPRPRLSSIKDVPRDQGGCMSLQYRRSFLDSLDYGDVTHYSIWRRVIEGAAGLEGAAGELPTKVAADAGALSIPADFEGPAIRTFPAGSAHAWEWIANVPAHYFDTYAYSVRSLYDSTAAGRGWQSFLVTAHTPWQFIYWDSPIDSGYSVDNLAPLKPMNFAGIQSISPPGLRLTWNANGELDLAHYNLYRSTSATFVPDPSKLISQPPGTSYLDAAWKPGDMLYYKLAGIDEHGNVGECADLEPDDITVGTLLQSWTAACVDGCIEITWSLSEAVDSGALAVSRAAGERSEFENASGEILPDGRSFTYRDADVEPGSRYRYRVELHPIDGSPSEILFETEVVATPAMPLTLYQNHPNPFNPSTTIRFYLPEAATLSLEIYDPAGRLVSRLADGARYERGVHVVEWNGSDTSGKSVSSGVYFCRLRTERTILTKKMILIR